MSTRTIKDAVDLNTNALIYFRGHAKATYMSNGATVEDTINSKLNKEEADTIYQPIGNYIEKSEIPTKVSELENDVPYALRSYVENEIIRLDNNYTQYQLKITEDNKLPYSFISNVPTELSQFNNDANYVTATDVNGEIDDAGQTYVTETLLSSELEKKQDKLVSGINVRTINGNSILGSGDIVIKNDNADILNLVYPVGSIYLSVNEVNPSTLFGFGEWEMIKDTFLLGAGDTYQAGSTGGEATHILTVNEMPSHTHNFAFGFGTALHGATTYAYGSYDYAEWVDNYRDSPNMVYGSGGNQPHNNMPPYLTVYIWKRIS